MSLEIYTILLGQTPLHCNCKPPSGNQVNSPVQGILFVIVIGIIIYVLYRRFSTRSGVGIPSSDFIKDPVAAP